MRINIYDGMVDGDDAIPEITTGIGYARITSRELDVTSRRCPQTGLCIYFRKSSLASNEGDFT